MLLELQNEILEMIASGGPLGATLDRLCELIECRVPSAICSILLVQEGVLHPLAGPSVPKHYAAALDGVAIGPDVGACGAAAYYARPVAVHDLLSDPRWTAFRDLVEPLGYRACWSSPIIKADGAVAGTFAFYFRETRGPSALEEELVAASVHLCAIAIERHDRAMERHRLAYHDTLTGLPNRAAFDRHARQVARTELGLILLDLDNLKFVNDTFGHRAGDELIRTTAERLQDSAEYVFRIGGDEFAIVCDAGDDVALETAAIGILDALKAPADCAGHTIIPRATAGGSLCVAGQEMAIARHEADLALYHAKDTSRGRFQIFDENLVTSITRRYQAAREVTLALAEDRIVPFYQPIIALEKQEIVGVEALCRIRRSDGGYISAGEFFEATEDAHVASEITNRMLNKITADIRAWRDRGVHVGHVAINVTTADFQTGYLKERLLRFAEQSGIPASAVVIEVTETVYLEQRADFIRNTITALREAGFRIALDDFGTGYAALSHLIDVPVDIIKIDRSFTRRMKYNDGALAIVEGLIGIARRLHIALVAEGVETEDQAAILRELGCQLVQGFLYSKAVDAMTLAEFVNPVLKGEQMAC
ncbi:MAG: EAL domain-containing protein [Rhizobium sp.]|nr:MAG: EAL domain-containing protein [Rhizobium sp.]